EEGAGGARRAAGQVELRYDRVAPVTVGVAADHRGGKRRERKPPLGALQGWRDRILEAPGAPALERHAPGIRRRRHHGPEHTRRDLASAVGAAQVGRGLPRLRSHAPAHEGYAVPGPVPETT